MIKWKDRIRHCGLPLSFTRFRVENDALFINKGLLSSYEEQVKLFRILDLSVKIDFIDKLFNQGTVILHTADKTNRVVYLQNILNPYQVRDKLSSWIDESRKENGINHNEAFIDNSIHSNSQYNTSDDFI